MDKITMNVESGKDMAGYVQAAVFFLALLTFSAIGAAECNDCQLTVKAISNDICVGDTAVFELTLTNVYDEAKIIEFSAKSSVTMVSNLSSRVAVGPYETRKMRVGFTPRDVTSGTYSLSITARGFGAEDTDDAIIRVRDCHNLILDSPLEISVCEGSVSRADVNIRNAGSKDDTYSVTVTGIPDTLDVSFLGGPVAVSPGESRTISLNVRGSGPYSEDDFGPYNITLNVFSSNTAKSKEIEVNLLDCHATRLEYPPEFRACPQGDLGYPITITNEGRLLQDYSLRIEGSCPARLQADSISLAPSESAQILVDLENDYVDCELTVVAESQYDYAVGTTMVSIIPCYAVDLEIIPSKMSACPGQPSRFDLKLTNIGFFADDYDLNVYGIDIQPKKTDFFLLPGESETTYLEIFGTWCFEQDIEFSAIARGKSSDTDSAALHLLPRGISACADLELAPARDPSTIDCEGGAYLFYVKNTGYTRQDISLSVEGNYTIQPSSLILLPQESRQAAVYLLPVDDASTGWENKTLSTAIVAQSQDRKAYLEISADFSKPSCKVVRPTLEIAPQIPRGGSIGSPTDRNDTIDQRQEEELRDSSFADLMIIILLVVALVLAALLFSKKANKKAPDYKKEDFFPEAGSSETRVTPVTMKKSCGLPEKDAVLAKSKKDEGGSGKESKEDRTNAPNKDKSRDAKKKSSDKLSDAIDSATKKK